MTLANCSIILREFNPIHGTENHDISKTYQKLHRGGVALIGVSLFAPVQAFAGAIIQPTGVTPSAGNPSGALLTPVVKIIDQSGLSTSYTSGVTDFDLYTATATHNSSPGNVLNPNYGQAAANAPLSFTFDLGAVRMIDAMAFWASQSNALISQSIGIKDFELYAGQDTMGTFLGSFTAPGATSAQPPVNAQIFTFNPATTQFITLQALNTYRLSNEGPGIGEVAFREVPEPLTMLGAGTAVGFGAFFKRKLNQKSKPDRDKA